MSYKLEKPYTNNQKIDFIVKYNHNRGLKIEETDKAIYALEAWEGINNLGELVDNTEIYEAEQTQKEAERVANLKLTKREVFLALYNDSGITPELVKSKISDPIALIEFEYANEYYRGNPLIDSIGKTLGYSKEQLDYLFEHKVLPIIENNSIPEVKSNA